MTTYTAPTLDMPNTVREGIVRDFYNLRASLIGARITIRVKDTPDNRAAADKIAADIDVLLDLYLAIRAIPTRQRSAR